MLSITRIAVAGALGVLASLASAQGPGTVLSSMRISEGSGGFSGVLDDMDRFGYSLANLGDLDGDGTEDLVVGAYTDDDGGVDRGAVWILFLETDGSVRSEAKISSTAGGFVGPLDDGDEFGRSVAPLGDFDGDGVLDLVVGAGFDDDGGVNRGAVWVLFLNPDGSVKGQAKISDTQGGFPGQISANQQYFGRSLEVIGDVDGDGIVDLVVGAPFHDELPALDGGAVWVLFLNSAGTVKSFQKIATTTGNFSGTIDFFDTFGSSLCALGDLDGDGVPDVAVGAEGDDDGGADFGAIWLLFLNVDGTVKAHQKISATQGNFQGSLDVLDRFGFGLESAGDLDGDGAIDLFVGAPGDDEGGVDRGAVWVLFLNSDGTVKSNSKISSTQGGFGGPLFDKDSFGRGVALFNDLDGDGRPELAVGAPYDDGLGADRGALWMLSLDAVLPAAFLIYGSGVNPPGSLVHLSGLPSLGTTLTLGLDNPLGTQGSGALSFLFLSIGPDSAFPAGTPVPGFGMAGPGQAGELLIDPSSSALFDSIFGATWSGAGQPAAVDLPVPADTSLLGMLVFAQGLLLDPPATFGVRFGLTDAAVLRVGP